MRQLVILGVPQTFPCLMAALSSLPAAQEQHMEWIRVDKPGHNCDFNVDDLEKLVKKAAKGPGEMQLPKNIMGGVRAHESWGNVFEKKVPLWSGAVFG